MRLLSKQNEFTVHFEISNVVKKVVTNNHIKSMSNKMSCEVCDGTGVVKFLSEGNTAEFTVSCNACENIFYE